MDATLSVNIVHGIAARENIRTIEVMIIADSGIDLFYPLDHNPGSAGAPDGEIKIQAADIRLTRTTGGTFDGTNFNATAGTLANRGFITLGYDM